MDREKRHRPLGLWKQCLEKSKTGMKAQEREKTHGKERHTHQKGELIGIYRKFVLYVLLIGIIQAVFQSLTVWLTRMLPGSIAIPIAGISNLMVIVTLVLILGWRYYRYLGQLGKGIEALSRGEKVRLSEEGVAGSLGQSINRTSELLEEQRQAISQRDTARMDWIRSISHDIRTPLSMVMGYSEILEEEPLSAEQRDCVAIIKAQSIKMKELIEDLNLTSKLEYDRQPLRMTELNLAELLRESVAGSINARYMGLRNGGKTEQAQRAESRGLAALQEKEKGTEETACAEGPEGAEGGDVLDPYNIDLIILPEFEGLTVLADHHLLRRVFDNLIGNAIRHNPEGCSIMIFAYCLRDRAIIEVRDDGIGIPDQVARIINGVGSEFLSPEELAKEGTDAGSLPDRPHIMGMRIAKQIMLAHGGNLIVKPDRHTVELIVPTPGTEDRMKETDDKNR